MKNASVRDACFQYGLCWNWLPSRKREGLISKELEEELEKNVTELRPFLCEKLGVPEDTSWEELWSICGLLISDKLTEEEEQKRYRETSSIELTGRSLELYEELHDIRYRITGQF